MQHLTRHRRLLLQRIAGGFTLMQCLPLTLAADPTWPSKSIRLIVPYAAGGGTDYFARALATRLSQRLGQSVVVENRPGAGTAIGAQEVARSVPDGHTLLLGDSATFSVNPSLYKKLSYDPVRDFEPVTLTGRFSLLLVVNPKVLDVTSVNQLVETGRQRAESLSYGTPGAGSPHHLAMELLADRAKLKLAHIPYKGTSPALTDLLGGRVPMMFINLATVAPHLKSGALRVLAVSGSSRMPALPDVPTISEAGISGYEAWAWQGLVSAAGTPRTVLDRLAREYQQLLNDVSFRNTMVNEAGIEPLHSSGAEMASYMKLETVKWERVVRQAGITAD